MTNPVKTCVLGVGLSGLTFHVPFILALPELFTLHAVLERNPKVEGGKVFERFGKKVIVHRTIEEVLADDAIELVVIGTPNETHYSFAKAALEAGKHVLVDKPVTATVAEAKELGKISKEKNLVLYAFQNRRWDSDFLAVKRLLHLPETSPKSIGSITEFESHFDRYRKGLKGTWKDQPLAAAGITYDLGAHLIDQTLVLFGRPNGVTAFIQNLRGVGDPKVDDSFTIHLHYDKNVNRAYPLTAILRSSPLSVRSPQARFVIRGTTGTFWKHGIDVQEEQLRVISSPNALLEERFGVEPEYLWGTLERLEADDVTVSTSGWPSVDAGAYIDLFKNLAGAIRDQEELAVKWEEATAVIELVELAHRIRVELPPYSTAFDVNVNEDALVFDLKREISTQCPGRPRPEGQRLIYRGRVLSDKESVRDLWKAEPRVVHLAVHPSAWSTTPPQIPPATSHNTQPGPPLSASSARDTTENITQRTHFSFPAQSSVQSSPFILYKHQEALAALCPAIKAPIPPSPWERQAALSALKRDGWQWPSELDAPYPPFSPGGLLYEYTDRSGQPYLSLRPTGDQPTPRQLHALKVLSATFTILSLPPSPTPTVPTSQSQNLPVPPHVNQLLQQLGLPPVRANPNGAGLGANPDLIPNPNNPAVEIRRIRLQPILGPLMMLTFRTFILLYFVAPARKPIFGILILAWMLYELWQPIRNGMRGVDGDANPANGAAPQQDPNPNPNPPNPNPNRQDNPVNAANGPARPRPAPLEQQASVILERLANMNIADEERILNEEPGAPTTEPTFGHKAITFTTLLLSTLHPAIWDRRRVALRRREGVVRTEENIRTAEDNESEVQRNLRERYDRRPRWIHRYIQRVVAEEWIDDSD